MRRTTLILSLFLATIVASRAELRTSTIVYRDGGTMMEGYLVWDDAVEGVRPGVLVFHEWMGLNDYARSRADQLARLGYVAFAADLYGMGVRPSSPQEAGKLSGSLKADPSTLRSRGAAALKVLRDQRLVDDGRLAAIGYCFGGTAALELARGGSDIAGVVSFHGGLATPDPADSGEIRAQVLVLHGAADPHVPAEEVAAFQEEMRRGGVDWYMTSYGGAVHAFTNPAAGSDPSRGAAYDADADRRSWRAMKDFFTEIFSAESAGR